MHADDTTLVLSGTSTENLAITSYISLNMAYQYCYNNDLAVNTTKTAQIAFGRRSECVPCIPEVAMNDEVKFLGITLDKNLSWISHVDKLCTKLSSSLFAIKNIKASTDETTTRAAYFALFKAHMRYGLVAWGGTSAGQIQRVLKKQKPAVRTLAGLQPLDSCKEAFRTQKILTIVSLYIQETVMHAVREGLPKRGEVHQYNLRDTTLYDLPAHRLSQFEKKPTYMGRKLLNHLPSELRDKEEKELKRAPHKWLADRPFYTIEEFFQRAFDI
uniref:Reverse transcriptase domain-containing protein n=1 Tax=Graphocephala atropunctata TaxID=36148 RepID=A0A1B6MT69_9HEMI